MEIEARQKIEADKNTKPEDFVHPKEYLKPSQHFEGSDAMVNTFEVQSQNKLKFPQAIGTCDLNKRLNINNQQELLKVYCLLDNLLTEQQKQRALSGRFKVIDDGNQTKLNTSCNKEDDKFVTAVDLESNLQGKTTENREQDVRLELAPDLQDALKNSQPETDSYNESESTATGLDLSLQNQQTQDPLQTYLEKVSNHVALKGQTDSTAEDLYQTAVEILDTAFDSRIFQKKKILDNNSPSQDFYQTAQDLDQLVVVEDLSTVGDRQPQALQVHSQNAASPFQVNPLGSGNLDCVIEASEEGESSSGGLGRHEPLTQASIQTQASSTEHTAIQDDNNSMAPTTSVSLKANIGYGLGSSTGKHSDNSIKLLVPSDYNESGITLSSSNRKQSLTTQTIEDDIFSQTDSEETDKQSYCLATPDQHAHSPCDKKKGFFYKHNLGKVMKIFKPRHKANQEAPQIVDTHFVGNMNEYKGYDHRQEPNSTKNGEAGLETCNTMHIKNLLDIQPENGNRNDKIAEGLNRKSTAFEVFAVKFGTLLQKDENADKASEMSTGPTNHYTEGEDIVKFLPNLHESYVHIDVVNDITPVMEQRKLIGQGGQGKVFKGYWQGKSVAVKLFNQSLQANRLSSSELKTMQDELMVMQQLDHKHIVRCYGGSLKAPYRAIVLEFLHNSLDRFIHSSRHNLSYFHMLKISMSICKALMYMHPTIVHRDIKPCNVLISRSGLVKLADFGLSAIRNSSYIITEQNRGTLQYAAPELYMKGRIQHKADMYSLAMLMWEMYTKERPWKGQKDIFIIYQVGTNNARLEIPHHCPAMYRKIIESCWNPNPKNRPEAEQVLEMLQQEKERLKSEERSSSKHIETAGS